MQDQPLPTVPTNAVPVDQQLVLPAPVVPGSAFEQTPATPVTMPVPASAPMPSPVSVPVGQAQPPQVPSAAPAPSAAPFMPAPAQNAAPQPPQPPMPVMAAAPAPTVAPNVSAPAMADDGDLIEKEWVTRVEQVVAATAHDPHNQSKQIAQLRAEYLQKRYGKVIKTEE